MTSAGKLTTKAIAVIIIIAMLDAVGVPPMIMVLFTGICFVVWFFARRAQAREVERIFDFYVAADAVLREEDRRWYGFEIAEVIEHGESLLDIMPDPPPLNYFALGALYHRLGNHSASFEYLSRLAEDERYDETHRTTPSPQLRHFVSMLRRIEYQPSLAPQTLAAIRSLERARHRSATRLLFESRELMDAQQLAAKEEKQPPETKEAHFEPMSPQSMPLSAITARPPIAKVLHDVYDVCDVYQDETRTSN